MTPTKKQLLAHIHKAIKLNQDGVKAPATRKTAAKPAPEVPAELVAALKKNKAAKATFDAFPPRFAELRSEYPLVGAARRDLNTPYRYA